MIDLSKKIFKTKFLVVILLALSLVFIFVFIFIKTREKTPSVISTDPKNNESNVLETKQISINLNTDISDKSKSNLTVNFDPQIQFDSTWLSNTYKIIPKNNLSNNTNYIVQVNYKNKEIYKFSFETNTFSQEDIQKYGPLQTQDDYDFGQTLTDIANKYPFYTNLPIKTQNYVVYYDFEQDKFAITLLIEPKDSSEEKEIIKGAVENIKKIGAKEPVLYYVNEYSDSSSTSIP